MWRRVTACKLHSEAKGCGYEGPDLHWDTSVSGGRSDE